MTSAIQLLYSFFTFRKQRPHKKIRTFCFSIWKAGHTTVYRTLFVLYISSYFAYFYVFRLIFVNVHAFKLIFKNFFHNVGILRFKNAQFLVQHLCSNQIKNMLVKQKTVTKVNALTLPPRLYRGFQPKTTDPKYSFGECIVISI